VQATEFGLSIARDFTIAERRVSIGVKPKVVDLRAFTFRESILTVEAGLENLDDEDRDTDPGTFTTVDMGFAVDLNESWLLGLMLRNLVTDDFDVDGQTLNFDTEAEMGIAYRTKSFTFGVDYDLLENKPELANDSFDILTVQYLSLGMEFKPTDFIALRVGVAKKRRQRDP